MYNCDFELLARNDPNRFQIVPAIVTGVLSGIGKVCLRHPPRAIPQRKYVEFAYYGPAIEHIDQPSRPQHPTERQSPLAPEQRPPEPPAGLDIAE